MWGGTGYSSSFSSVKFSTNWVAGVMSPFGNATTRCGMLSRGMRWSFTYFCRTVSRGLYGCREDA